MLSNLDKELVAVLQPLAEVGVTLYYPFFANTFPIAFHLWQASKTYLPPRGEPSKVCIRQVQWEAPVGGFVHSTNPPSVFYGTKRALTPLIKAKSIIACKVCLYQPRSIFVEQSPNALEIARRSEPIDLNNMAAIISELLDGRSQIDIYSDIPIQANAILEPARSKFPLHFAQGHAPPTESLSYALEGPPYSDSLRLYLYSGALSAYLRRKSNRFIEFPLSTVITADVAADFETYVCTSPLNEQLADALETYHTKLFSAAKADSSNEFWPVCDAYNRLARSHQHRSSFHSAPEYARCLREHHSDEMSPPRRGASFRSPKKRIPKIRFRGDEPFVFFGCGQLAVGLVLPALHPELPLWVVQVARSGGKFEWSSLQQRKAITLANSLGYRESYKILPLADANLRSLRKIKRCLILADSMKDAVKLAKDAKWIGTCLGDGLKDFGKDMAAIEFPSRPQVPLFLFENRIDDIKPFQTKLEIHFDIHHVLCDRICNDRKLTPGKLFVTAETYGEIVVADNFSPLFGSSGRQVPFTGHVSDLGTGNVETESRDSEEFNTSNLVIRLIPRDENFNDTIELFRRRKRWLMNSVQHVLALVAAQACIERHLDYDHMPVYLADSLLNKSEPDARSSVEIFIQCQIARMMVDRGQGGDTQRLVNIVLKPFDELSLYHNLRLFVEASRMRCGSSGAVPDMIKRLIANDREGFKKAADKFKEHVDEAFKFVCVLSNLKIIKSLGVPFSPSECDLTVADSRLAHAQIELQKHVVSKSRFDHKPSPT